jgi:uncharacterized protein (DUF362 family)
MLNDFDRRGFLRLTGAAALAAAIADLVGPGAILRVARAQDSPSDVTVVGLSKQPTQDEIDKRVREAIFATTDMSWLKPGQTVAIKVASNSGRPYPFTTHPGALKSVIKLLKERGAGRVIVADQPGTEWVMAPLVPSDKVGKVVREVWGGIHSGTSTAKEVLEMNGLWQAATEAGAEVKTFDLEADWEPPGPPTAHWPHGFRIPKLYGQVDHVVSLARPAGHVMAGHTGTVKTWYGWLHPNDRLASHRDVGWIPGKGLEVKNLHECVAEVAAAFKGKTRLNMVIAIGTYADIGPDWGSQPLESSMVIASTDMAAADAVTAALVAYEKNRVPESERAKNWQSRPWYKKWFEPWRDETFWGGIESGFHTFHGSQGWDQLQDHPTPGGVWDLRQLRRARELGIGAANGVNIKVAGDAPIDGAVDKALHELTGPPTEGFTKQLGGGK